MALSLDQMLEKIGSLGWYQIRLTFIVTYIEFTMALQIMSMTFLAAEPPWHCLTNSTNCTLEGYHRPGEEHFKYRCEIPRNEWDFKSDFISLVTEYNLVCGKTFMASLSSSIIFAGWFIGAIVGGLIADKYGRKPTICVFAVLMSILGLIIAFPKVFWAYIVLRFFIGFSRGCAGGSMFVILTEYVGIRHRHVLGTLMFFAWPLSGMLLAGIGYVTRDWRTQSIVVGVLGMPVVFCWCFIPESTRYLLLKNKVHQCDKILRDIARANRKKYPEDVTLDNPSEGTELRLGDFRDLFGSRSYIHRILVMWIAWMANGLVGYGIPLSVPDLEGSMYLNYFFTQVPGLFGIPMTIYLMEKLGRKKSEAFGFLVASVSAIGAVLMTQYDPGHNKGYLAGRIIMGLLAISANGLTFGTVYVYTAELFPTAIRNIALGTGTASARIGAFCAPFVVSLDRIHALLPYGVMGLVALFAGILCLTLPETKGLPTAETVTSRDVCKLHTEEMKLLNDVDSAALIENEEILPTA